MRNSAKNTSGQTKPSSHSGANSNAVKSARLPFSVYASSAFINFLGLALPLTILHVYDRVLPNQAFNTLTMLIIGLFGVVLLDSVLRIARGATMGWRAASFGHRHSMDAMARLMSAKASDIQSTKASAIISQFQALSDMAEFQGSTARLLMIDIAWVPVFAIVITIIAGPLIIVPIVCLVAFVLFISRQTSQLRNIIDKREALEERKYDFLLETLQTMQTVKSQAMESLMMRRFERLQSSSSLELKQNVLASQTISQTAGLFALIMTMGVVFFGALMVIGNSLTIGALAACMLLSSQMMQPIMRSLQSWTQIVQNEHKQAEVDKLYNQISDQPVRFKPVARRQPEFAPVHIRIQDLTFRSTNDRVVFEDLNLHISAGQFVGLKGADGSGRSVLLRNILGEICPTEGEVFINGLPAHEARSKVSYVGQVPQVFKGSILDNLTLFGTYTAADAKWIADLCGLSPEIHKLPDGFDTQLLGSSNPELSTAFSQLICIARAIVSKPSVLLLDASNNGLDAKTEAAFSQMLQRLTGDITMILATQRPSLLRTADFVYELADKKGQIVSMPSPPLKAVPNERAVQ
ncbi:MAG: ATP-binding cassette domain-containing protein [Pseudomonadota bacterium]